MITHYTYRITNKKDNIHYYGVRSTPKDISPYDDLGVRYFSSSKIVKSIAKNNKDDFKFKVVRVFKSRSEAMLHEGILHLKFDVKNNNKFYNQTNAIGDTFVTVKGINKCTLTVYDIIDRKNKKISTNEFISNNTRYRTPMSKKVYQFDMDGLYIKSYKTVSDAVKETRNSGIYRCCLGMSQQSGGFRWSYSINIKPLIKNKKTPKKLYKYSSEYEETIYNNFSDAVKDNQGHSIKMIPNKSFCKILPHIISTKKLNKQEVDDCFSYNSQVQSAITRKKLNKTGAKKVYQYDENMNLIKIWNKISDVYSSGYSSHVGILCRDNTIKLNSGYYWSYLKLN